MTLDVAVEWDQELDRDELDDEAYSDAERADNEPTGGVLWLGFSTTAGAEQQRVALIMSIKDEHW